MESEGLLPYSQEPSTGSYSQPDQSNPYHPIRDLRVRKISDVGTVYFRDKLSVILFIDIYMKLISNFNLFQLIGQCYIKTFPHVHPSNYSLHHHHHIEVPLRIISKSSLLGQATTQLQNSIFWLCFEPDFKLTSCSAYSLTLKMEATCFSETSVDFQRTIRHYIPEDRTLDILYYLNKPIIFLFFKNFYSTSNMGAVNIADDRDL
jgi:hypothetical protein